MTDQVRPRVSEDPIPLPVEPLFDLKCSALLIPMSLSALRTFLSRHKAEFPARYGLQGPEHRRIRLLYAAEIKVIRKRVLRGALWSPFLA